MAVAVPVSTGQLSGDLVVRGDWGWRPGLSADLVGSRGGAGIGARIDIVSAAVRGLEGHLGIIVGAGLIVVDKEDVPGTVADIEVCVAKGHAVERHQNPLTCGE